MHSHLILLRPHTPVRALSSAFAGNVTFARDMVPAQRTSSGTNITLDKVGFALPLACDTEGSGVATERSANVGGLSVLRNHLCTSVRGSIVDPPFGQ